MNYELRISNREELQVSNLILTIISGMEKKGKWNKHPIKLLIRNNKYDDFIGSIDITCRVVDNDFRILLIMNPYIFLKKCDILGYDKEMRDLSLMSKILHEYRHYEQWCWMYNNYGIDGVYKLAHYNNANKNENNMLEIDAIEYEKYQDIDLDKVMNNIWATLR